MRFTRLTGVLSALRPFHEFLFPPCCFACGRPMARSAGRICPACLGSLRRVSPADGVYRAALLGLQENSALSGLFVPFHFDDQGALQQVIHQLKYGGGKILGRELGFAVGALIRSSSFRDGILVPVPLHRTKQRERGYNQAEEVCRGIAEITGWPVRSDIVVRRKYTSTQTKLNPAERRANVRNAFAVLPGGPPVIEGKEIFLVDDVITTGSTIGECGSILLASGAAKVYACAAGLAE